MRESQYYNPKFDDIALELESKIGLPKCPHCQIQKSFNPSTFRLPFDDSAEMKPEEFGKHYPFLALQCSKCGHTDFYDAQKFDAFKN
ncbi:hypothetical protein [Salinicoccus carnicancri]|uniref:hypothetical protein n=1 Tax=Salinicoccus carnicancri TaxID=558170 RepID=UPI00031C90E4|nr:hypothetical protein [Salinicoccus carnicancri]